MVDFLLSAPLWLQVPLLLVFILPMVAMFSLGLLWAIDRGTYAAVGAWRSMTGDGE